MDFDILATWQEFTFCKKQFHIVYFCIFTHNTFQFENCQKIINHKEALQHNSVSVFVEKSWRKHLGFHARRSTVNWINKKMNFLRLKKIKKSCQDWSINAMRPLWNKNLTNNCHKNFPAKIIHLKVVPWNIKIKIYNLKYLIYLVQGKGQSCIDWEIKSLNLQSKYYFLLNMLQWTIQMYILN